MTTSIEWTDETWNPTTGCDRISPGCDNCYALTMAARLKAMGQAKYQNDGDPRTSGPGFGLTEHPDALDLPLTWRKPRKVFVNSMSDLFHRDITDDFIARVFAVMAIAEQHTFQVLTKRPQRMAELLASAEFQRTVGGWAIDIEGGWEDAAFSFDWPLPNVWLGTSIETDRYTFRADHLRATPAAVRWISAEPLLGPLPSLDLTSIDWVVVGGESGPGARPMHPQWVRDLRDRCQTRMNVRWQPATTSMADRHAEWVPHPVAFLFKQWGAWGPAGAWPGPDHHVDEVGHLYEPGVPCSPGTRDLAAMHLWGKKAAGRELDGRTWDEYPVGAG